MSVDVQTGTNRTELGGVVWPDRNIYYNEKVYTLTIWFCAIAMAANIINLVVLTRPDMRSSLNFLLTSLAVSDILFICVKASRSVIYFAWPTIQEFVNVISLAWVDGLYILENTTALLSEWLNLIVGFWRFLAVTWPLRSKSWCTLSRAKFLVVVVAVVAFLVVFPCAYNYTLEERDLDGQIVNALAVRTLTGYKYLIFHDIFMPLMCALYIIPIVCLIIITIFLIRNMRIALKDQRNIIVIVLAESHHRKNRISLILVIIMIVFIITNTPTALFAALYLVPIDSLTDYRNYFFILQIVDRTTTFFSFFLLSSKYRRTCSRVFFGAKSECCKRPIYVRIVRTLTGSQKTQVTYTISR